MQWLQKSLAYLIYFLEQIIIHILEQEEAEWLFMEKKVLTVPFIIFRILHLEQNLNVMWKN